MKLTELLQESIIVEEITLEDEQDFHEEFGYLAYSEDENDLFPHCKSRTEKIYFLGLMVKKIIDSYIKDGKGDDRDSYVNKRVELTGTLINNLFRNYFNKMTKDIHKQVVREINNGSWKSSEDYTNIINLTNSLIVVI